MKLAARYLMDCHFVLVLLEPSIWKHGAEIPAVKPLAMRRVLLLPPAKDGPRHSIRALAPVDDDTRISVAACNDNRVCLCRSHRTYPEPVPQQAEGAIKGFLRCELLPYTGVAVLVYNTA